ncbi:MAG: VWA domain-containing protein, partial [Candidatus Tectomicrobia bacterium]|nr:VWA domain-containing protein [Candidatus Tectomicrobia bacterium]
QWEHEKLQDLDPDHVAEILGEEARKSLEMMKQILKMLEEAGYIQKIGDEFRLTPLGLRKLGEKALHEIFANMKKDQFGDHRARVGGFGIERFDETKRYEFGDPFTIDLNSTFMNTLQREMADGPRVPIHMNVDDFEVFKMEYSSRSATVLVLDSTWSMTWGNKFAAAKKVALALNSLIQTKYPRDVLYLVRFEGLAMEIKMDELAYVTETQTPYRGTNIQHALQLSRHLLSKESSSNKQILIITDAQPTAHIENGRLWQQYPPTRRTLEMTLKEAYYCRRAGITINLFMLDTDPYLREFAHEMAQANKGRAFFTTPERIGEYILIDYQARKRKRIA